MRLGSGTRTGPAGASRSRWPGGDDINYVHCYVALARLGLRDTAGAVAHARRARELAYPEALLKSAPEPGDIRTMI